MSDDALGSLYRRVMVLPRASGGEACPSPEALRAMAEGTIRAEERLAVAEHVSACADCQGELALLSQVVGTRGATLRSFVPVRWLAAAAVIALAVLGGRVLATRGGVAPVMRGDASALALVAPSGTVGADGAPTFVWRSVERAERYEVEVLGPEAVPVATVTVRDTVMPAPEGLVAGSYAWRVTAVRADGTRVESLVARFDLVRD